MNDWIESRKTYSKETKSYDIFDETKINPWDWAIHNNTVGGAL